MSVFDLSRFNLVDSSLIYLLVGTLIPVGAWVVTRRRILTGWAMILTSGVSFVVTAVVVAKQGYYVQARNFSGLLSAGELQQTHDTMSTWMAVLMIIASLMLIGGMLYAAFNKLDSIAIGSGMFYAGIGCILLDFVVTGYNYYVLPLTIDIVALYYGLLVMATALCVSGIVTLIRWQLRAKSEAKAFELTETAS